MSEVLNLATKTLELKVYVFASSVEVNHAFFKSTWGCIVQPNDEKNVFNSSYFQYLKADGQLTLDPIDPWRRALLLAFSALKDLGQTKNVVQVIVPSKEVVNKIGTLLTTLDDRGSDLMHHIRFAIFSWPETQEDTVNIQALENNVNLYIDKKLGV